MKKTESKKSIDTVPLSWNIILGKIVTVFTNRNGSFYHSMLQMTVKILGENLYFV
jgi:hypothetical protein